jgi:signal transduction histidine kinase
MKIKNKITYSFTLTVAIVLAIFAVIIYVISAQYREDQFYTRLKEKAITTSRLLIEIEQVDSVLMHIISNADQTILYQENIIIFDTLFHQVFQSRDELKSLITSEMHRYVLENREFKKSISGTEILGTIYTDRENRFVVFASAYDIYGYNKLTNLRNVLLVGFFFIIILTFFLGRIFAERSLMPISKVINQVDNISVNNLSVRVDVEKNKDEIDHLATTFNSMLARLENAFEAQRSFVSNASHELRTPITSVLGQIEVALLFNRSVDEYSYVLQSVKEDIVGISDLTNRLLMLAQTNTSIPVTSFIECRIDEIIFQARAELTKHHPAFNVGILFVDEPTDEVDLELIGSPQLLKVAFINLMENGCKFAEIPEVFVEIGFNKDNLFARFIDYGPGIPENDIENVFQPFFRSEINRSVSGHGIGLSLVSNILKIHNGSIEIKSSANGCVISVSFPRNFKGIF